MIFDNVTDAEDLIDYLPRIRTGHVLITSRNMVWRDRAECLPVPELARSCAVEFLLKRTGSKDLDSAEQLAEVLGELPLALEHAGA